MKSPVITACMAILLILLLLKFTRQYASLKFKTRKTIPQRIGTLVGILAILVIGFLYAPGIAYQCFTAIGMLLVFFITNTEGVCNSGLLVLARGKNTIGWGEIAYLTIQRGDILTVQYFDSRGLAIEKHRFSPSLETDLVLFLKGKTEIRSL